ncbi:MAG: ferrous iron transport protein A [Candidatus Omnitrophica bacterium]|nr:ferrous iron transport protein A [Candidatus Omnitrophota bacterium]
MSLSKIFSNSNPQKKDIEPLISLKNGQKGIISSIKACPSAVRRLGDMGLTPNTEIKVIQSAPFHGPVQIFARGSKLAIGRGIAMKIFVKVKK